MWTMLVENELLEEDFEISHLLWAMYFLKCYPQTEEGCSAAASENGAVDPKTWRKHIWPVIYALSDLESAVVSLCIDFLPSKYSSNIPFLFQITFEDRKLNKRHDTHLSVDCTDCRIQQKGPGFALYKFKDKPALGMRFH